MAVDTELAQALNKAVAGEEEGFNIIYQKTYSYVYARCRMIMKNEDDAQELLQETYLQAYKSLDKLENVNGIFAWIGAIAYNQGMKVFRKKKEVLLDEDGQGLFEVQETADVSTLPGHEMELKETADIVKDIIEELPDVQRAVITAYYYDEMSVSKIAELMGTSTGTIKSRLNYARKHIQESVEAKEKQMGIKLHSVSVPVLILALQGKANAMSMPAEIAEANYAAICSKSGITAAGLHAGDAGAVASNVASGEVSVASVEAAGATEGIVEAAKGGTSVANEISAAAEEITAAEAEAMLEPIVTSAVGAAGKGAATALVTKIIAGVAVLGVVIGGAFVAKYIKEDEDTVALITTEEVTAVQENASEETEEVSTEQTSEDVTEEVSEEDNTEKTAMETELMTAKIRNEYMGAVWQVLQGKWVDGSDLVADDFSDMSENTFALADVTGDGNEELIILYTGAAVANMRGGIYGYNTETGIIEELLYTGANPVIYSNGIVEVNISHDASGGGGDIWPHNLYKYNPDTKVYDEVGYVDDFEDAEDPSKKTYVIPGSLDNVVDADSYNKWHDEFYGGAVELDITWEAITRENIRKYSLEYFDQVDKMEQADTPGVYDIGIAYVENGLQDEHPSAILDYVESGYSLETGSSEDGYDNEVSYNGTPAFNFYFEDACEITYKNVQVDNIVMLGLYPGMDENEAYAKLEAYGLKRIDNDESVTYVSGENADNIELKITAEDGKISTMKITFRPILAG